MSRNNGGRPPGRKNREYVHVEDAPPACPQCGNTKLRAVPGADPIIREITGTLAAGREYNRVIWRRKECTAHGCTQRLMVRSYEKEVQAAVINGK